MGNLSGNIGISSGIGQEAGCLRNPVRQIEKRAGGFDGHAFLNHPFTGTDIVSRRELLSRNKVEQGFFRSLFHFCNLYGLEVPECGNLPYPANIAMSFDLVSDRFGSLGKGLSLSIFQTERSSTSIATVKPLSVGCDLYYIPVGFIYGLWEDSKSPKMVDLALSLFAFLYQVMEVPFYTEHHSFLVDCYEDVKHFMEDELENGMEYEENLAEELLEEVDRIQTSGHALLREISDRSRRDLFGVKVGAFRPRNKKETSLLEVCKEALAFQENYPGFSVWEATPYPYPVDEDERVMSTEMYIGFHWGNESDWLEENIREYVNNRLMDCGVVQAPAAIQLFNRKTTSEKHDLRPHKAMIDLLENVASALYAFQLNT